MSVIRCPECNELVVGCQNEIWLDYPAVVYDEVAAPWTIRLLDGAALGSTGNASVEGTGHSLHEHQPKQEAS